MSLGWSPWEIAFQRHNWISICIVCSFARWAIMAPTHDSHYYKTALAKTHRAHQSLVTTGWHSLSSTSFHLVDFSSRTFWGRCYTEEKNKTRICMLLLCSSTPGWCCLSKRAPGFQLCISTVAVLIPLETGPNLYRPLGQSGAKFCQKTLPPSHFGRLIDLSLYDLPGYFV